MSEATGIIILGTARDDSNTLREVVKNVHFVDFKVIELHRLNIQPYAYSQKPNDDFLGTVDKLIASNVIVFATPVYWYAMSGTLKIFFDRLTDLITTSKHLGRALAGKETYLFATGTDDALPDGFEVPFRKTSAYFSMKYQKAFYVSVAGKDLHGKD